MNLRANPGDIPARARIGIIAGSGPEAGADLFLKVIRANQRQTGAGFRGDLDAPPVVLLSEPELGLSMELPRHEDKVWQRLRDCALRIGPQCDVYAVACNTLNWFAPRLLALETGAQLLSFQSVLAGVLAANPGGVALLGAEPVMALGPWSAYHDLAGRYPIETPADHAALHALIYDIKRLGGDHPDLPGRFGQVLEPLRAKTVVLACTELPLVPMPDSPRNLVDLTDLVANALVTRSLAGRSGDISITPPTTGV